jgi:catechol 2,3-dioxygenase-like lactoylglutathione lyase family enzyme
MMNAKANDFYPRSINHIGVIVSDLDKAIEWYQKVLGYYLIIGPIEIAYDNHTEQIARDILGTRFRRGRFAHLSAGNQVGLELCEFDDPEAGMRENNMEFWKNGYFHLAVTDSDVAGLVERITANGGKQRTKIWEIFPGKGRYLAFCEDPWGNIIEIYSHSYELTWTST